MLARPEDEASIARDVLESLVEGCQVVDFDFRYAYVNGAVATHARCAREQLLGRTMAECFPGIEKTQMFDVLRRCMSERVRARMENEFTYPDGSTGWFELRFVPVPEGVCIVSLDITESKRVAGALARSEAQLRHAQKMEAVGRLAGGLAHDFNNVLSVVLSYAELILSELPPGSTVSTDVLEIRRAGERGAELTKQLLAFSRQQVLQPKLVQLDASLASIRKMIERLVGADVEVMVLPSNAPCTVRIDPAQFEHALMNLVVNARDAMPRGGKLTLQVNEADLDDAYAREHVGVAAGRYVMLAVSDTGVGMDRDTQARIFEPFFTTKERGKGTGLGLSSVFGFVNQSGGHVWVYSEPGKGTTFKIYLPRAAANDEGREAPWSLPAAAPRGTETILLVEDDDQVRAATSGILRRSGYVVLDTSSPGEALLASEQHEARIDLLLTDVVLPRMSGARLASRLSATRPEMKVLFMSGYTDEAVLLNGLLESGAAYLEKPITPHALTTKVREALATPHAS